MNRTEQKIANDDRFRSYQGAVRFLEGLSNLPVKANYQEPSGPGAQGASTNPEIYLARLRYFLDLLDNPQKGPQYVHIAGTAGKGTVAGMVQAALAGHGRRCGLFTSPFPTTTIECIQVDDHLIAPSTFAQIVDTLKPAVDHAYVASHFGGPSYFEILLAVAFLYFQMQACDWVVLEAGLGGRYDATNVIEQPAITAITNVGYDHTDILGATLEEIARNKAGIIKRGSRFWTAETNPELLSIFHAACQENAVPFHSIADKLRDHRERNRALAFQICSDVDIPEALARQAIAKHRLPCRFETMARHPLVILDGAHNASKMAATMLDLSKESFRHLHLVMGLAGNKDAEAIFLSLTSQVDHLYLTRYQTKDRQCTHPMQLAALAKGRFNPNTTIDMYLDPERALDAALAAAGPDDAVLVTGSFFLAGELRTRWFPETTILSNRHSF